MYIYIDILLLNDHGQKRVKTSGLTSSPFGRRMTGQKRMEQTTSPSYKPLLNKRRCCHQTSTPKQMESWNHLPEKHIIGWWSEPIWKILVKLDHLPQVEVKIKDAWKHHLDTYGNLMVPSPMPPPRNTSLWRDKPEPPWSSKALISLGRWLKVDMPKALLRGTHIFTSPRGLIAARGSKLELTMMWSLEKYATLKNLTWESLAWIKNKKESFHCKCCY